MFIHKYTNPCLHIICRMYTYTCKFLPYETFLKVQPHCKKKKNGNSNTMYLIGNMRIK